MIALIQRVSEASVRVDQNIIGSIDAGILALVAIEKGDSEQDAEKLADRLLNYRIFSDESGRMNLSLREISGGLLLVSQFTLAADTRKGLRPSFTPAADPSEGQRLFRYLTDYVQSIHDKVATGQFGADMKVALINDGPVTFHIRIPPSKAT
jgi:D-aminoacyl-tRNA deacylase